MPLSANGKAALEAADPHARLIGLNTWSSIGNFFPRPHTSLPKETQRRVRLNMQTRRLRGPNDVPNPDDLCCNCWEDMEFESSCTWPCGHAMHERCDLNAGSGGESGCPVCGSKKER